MTRIPKFSLLLLSLLISLNCSTSAQRSRKGDSALESKPPSYDSSCKSSINNLLLMLNAPSKNQRDSGKEKLLAFANQSAEARKCVVTELVQIAAAPAGCGELLASSGDDFLRWEAATDVLGDMHATDAIDSLVSRLDCSLATGLSVDTFPAARAVIKIGEACVPALARALNQATPGVRITAVEALVAIGGEKARQALISASPNQTDKEVRKLIRIALRQWQKN